MGKHTRYPHKCPNCGELLPHPEGHTLWPIRLPLEWSCKPALCMARGDNPYGPDFVCSYAKHSAAQPHSWEKRAKQWLGPNAAPRPKHNRGWS